MYICIQNQNYMPDIPWNLRCFEIITLYILLDVINEGFHTSLSWCHQSVTESRMHLKGLLLSDWATLFQTNIFPFTNSELILLQSFHWPMEGYRKEVPSRITLRTNVIIYSKYYFRLAKKNEGHDVLSAIHFYSTANFLQDQNILRSPDWKRINFCGTLKLIFLKILSCGIVNSETVSK